MEVHHVLMQIEELILILIFYRRDALNGFNVKTFN